MRRTSSYLLLAAILLSVLFAVLTTAQAQTNNTIYACYDKTNGNLRKVNSPADCRTSEVAVAWNIQGPKGDKGDKGDQGIQGPPGDSGGGLDIFGNGSDGDVEISSDTTLTRDMYYHNLTIDDGVTLNPGGYRVFVSGTLTLLNGKIFRDGISAEPDVSGICIADGLKSGTLGGSGDWTKGAGFTNSLGGWGGAAANGFDGQFTSPPRTSFADFSHSWFQAVTLRTLDGQLVNGGAAGGPLVFVPGVCGGSGGGVILIAAHAIAGSGWIRAHGGNGWNSGGGGGGGFVVIITTTPRPATAVAPTTNEENRTVAPLAANDAQNESSTRLSSGTSRTRNSRQPVYYDYNNTSQKRSFWEKHRDKLTVAGGAGAGALVGGLIGGKKGAGVGLLAGGGGSALYTYKLRHKRHRY